jgi:hypothetical protein
MAQSCSASNWGTPGLAFTHLYALGLLSRTVDTKIADGNFRFFDPNPTFGQFRLELSSSTFRSLALSRLDGIKAWLMRGTEFPVRALFLPVHQDVEIGGAFLAVGGGLTEACGEPVSRPCFIQHEKMDGRS